MTMGAVVVIVKEVTMVVVVAVVVAVVVVRIESVDTRVNKEGEGKDGRSARKKGAQVCWDVWGCDYEQ